MLYIISWATIKINIQSNTEVIKTLKLKKTFNRTHHSSWNYLKPKLTGFVFLRLARMYQPKFELLCKERATKYLLNLGHPSAHILSSNVLVLTKHKLCVDVCVCGYVCIWTKNEMGESGTSLKQLTWYINGPIFIVLPWPLRYTRGCGQQMPIFLHLRQPSIGAIRAEEITWSS